MERELRALEGREEGREGMNIHDCHVLEMKVCVTTCTCILGNVM